MSQPGLYSNLVPSGQTPITGTVASGLDVGTLIQIRNRIWGSVLPNGALKTALMSMDGSLFGVFDVLKSLITGRKYSVGEYTLGERLIDQIQCAGNVNQGDVPDQVVPLARLVFTMLFGVRINNDIDLSRLSQSADAYYNNNPNRLDQPRAAVDRAVYLAKNYFSPATYNNTCWDLRIFDRYPLIAPVPEMRYDDDNQNRGKYYSGPGFNGQQFVNGLLASGPSTGLTSNIDTDTGSGTTAAGSMLDKIMSFVKTNPLVIVAVAAAGYYAIEEND